MLLVMPHQGFVDYGEDAEVCFLCPFRQVWSFQVAIDRGAMFTRTGQRRFGNAGPEQMC
jgi:hypothetical protein